MNRPEVNKTYIQEKMSKCQLSENQKNLLAKYLFRPISYVPHDRFKRAERMKSILDQNIKVISGKLLTADHEQTLFQQMNYARYRMSQIRRMILQKSRWPESALHELLHWHQYQQDAYSKIVTANMGLVLTLAKRCNVSRLEFSDLVSEGNMSLMRATEKFDVGRGFKFSTYAWRSIIRSFYRAIKQHYRYYNRFQISWDMAIEKDDSLEQAREENLRQRVDDIRTLMNQNLAYLSPMEQSVVAMRFSFQDPQQSFLTLKQVGSKFGFSKERIRQIQNKALSKLRIAAENRMS